MKYVHLLLFNCIYFQVVVPLIRFFFLFQKKTSNKSEIVKPNTYTWTKQDCRRKGEMGRGNKMFEFKRKWKQNKEKEDVFQNNNLFDANKTTKTTMPTMPNHFLAHIAEKWQQRNWINSQTKKKTTHSIKRKKRKAKAKSLRHNSIGFNIVHSCSVFVSFFSCLLSHVFHSVGFF